MPWQQIDNTNSAGWGVIGTSQTAGWSGVDVAPPSVALDALGVFGGAAFAETSFAGEQETHTPIGVWNVIEVV